jgi:hypothetical protein
MFMEIDMQKALQIMSMLNLVQPVRRNEPVEEMKEALTQPLNETSRQKTQNLNPQLETIQAVEKFFQGFIPNTDHFEERSQKLRNILREVEKRDKEELIELVKIMAESIEKARERREEKLNPFKVYTTKFPWE